jgi:hypothetical protein
MKIIKLLKKMKARNCFRADESQCRHARSQALLGNGIFQKLFASSDFQRS